MEWKPLKDWDLQPGDVVAIYQKFGNWRMDRIEYGGILFVRDFDFTWEDKNTLARLISRATLAPMRIEAGKYYRTRDGERAFVECDDGERIAPLCVRHLVGKIFHDRNGEAYGATNGFDLIAEWVEPADTPAPIPHGHARLPDGSVVDLTANTEAHDLMQPDKRAAMEAHGGPYVWHDDFGWVGKSTEDWFARWVYRVAPKPAAPREGWIVATMFASAREAKTAHPGSTPIRVREVMDGEE